MELELDSLAAYGLTLGGHVRLRKDPAPAILALTALPKEFVAVKAMLDEARERQSGRAGGMVLGTAPSSDDRVHHVCVAMPTAMGNNLAAIRVSFLLCELPSVRYVVMVGIAGGVPNPEKAEEHVRLGDVVVSGKEGVVQFDLKKDSRARSEIRNPPRPPSQRLLEAANFAIADQLEGRRPWLDNLRRAAGLPDVVRPEIETDLLADVTDPKEFVAHPPDGLRVLGLPKLILGAIGSSNTVLKNGKLREKLRQEFGLRAIEMEASGVADACWCGGVPFLVIRGICDYCDERKNDAWQGHAAVVASAFFRGLLSRVPADV